MEPGRLRLLCRSQRCVQQQKVVLGILGGRILGEAERWFFRRKRPVEVGKRTGNVRRRKRRQL